MSWSYVTIDRQPPLAIVRFDRHGNLNAFNQQLVRELTEAAREFHDDLDIHYVVLAGAAEAFSAGADLKDVASWQLAEKTDVQRRHRFYAGVRLCKAWEQMPQITIAAMERMAVGAGVAIALACDWRVLGRGAFLYVPEVKIGLNLQWGAFLASGDERHIVNVLAALGSGEPGLASSARFTLAQNAAAHPRVLDICRSQLDKQPAAVRAELKAALNSAGTQPRS